MSDSQEREEAAGPSETLRPESAAHGFRTMKNAEDMADLGSPTHSGGGELTADTITCEDNINKSTDKEVLRRVKEKHKASLKRRFENISEGIIKPGAEILLNKIYTELYITEGESEGVNKEHEVWQVESASRLQTTEDKPISCNDIFTPLPGQERHIRTVITKGIAGIGKTVSVQKFILDWTEGIASHDVDFMFPLPFRELNLIRSDEYSLHKLLIDFHPELKELKDGEEYNDFNIVFIFDGLDESRLPLNFQQSMTLSHLKQAASVNILMTSLIQGTLFPSAHIWITSRPAAAGQIPAQYINQVTEIRGFTHPQKEEYFKKRISNESQANRVILHIKASRSLHIMCHIPVFCWIAATVLQQMLEQDNTQKIPKTLTEMFVHFLLIQTKKKDQKYQGRYAGDVKRLLQSQKEVILKLSELAFKNLENGNLMFYEEDLQKCGIDVSEASVYSGMCTEIFKEESVFQQRKVYCFVHLSIQEFLAAVFVFHSYVNENFEALQSLLSEKHRDDTSPFRFSYFRSVLGSQSQDNLCRLLKSAVDEALKSRNGHLDLFLRFLVGVSLERNQRLLKGLLNCTYKSSKSIKKTCHYIKQLNSEGLSPERCINLFHCLFEMNDHSMYQEIKKYLESPKDFKGQLSPAHCSALAHMLLMSEEVLDEFELKKYNTSDEGRRRLIPALRCFRIGRLAGCKLTDKSCELVASVLQSPNSLIELDLSNNDLGDSGVQLLSKGLSSPHCKLQTLRLAGCKLTDKSCEIVTTVLQSPNSLIELDLSNNDLGDSGVQLLSKGLSSPHCKLQTLRLAGCKLTDKSCKIVTTVLQSPNSLIELDLSKNDLGDSGVQLLSKGLSSPHCKLQTLRLADCKLTDKSCELVASVLQSPNSLIELDLSDNELGDSGVQLLSKGLSSPHCKLQTLRLAGNKLTDKSCELVASVLKSPNTLTELDLSNKDLGDSGVQLLSKGLSSPHCKLQILRLCKCGFSSEGYVCLALALMVNPSCVKELDVSNNHPGESAQKLLSATMENPHRKVGALQLAGCKLTFKSCELVASVLQSPNSLIKLDLNTNDLGDSGAQLLSKGLSSPQCRLQTLSLQKCNIGEEGFTALASALRSNPSHIRRLLLMGSKATDSGVKHLSSLLEDPNCKLEELDLQNCNIGEEGFTALASALRSNPSHMRQLWLRGSKATDSGVKHLSSLLEDPNCKLEKLNLKNCSIGEEGFTALASALRSNPSHMRVLFLRGSKATDSGVKHLSSLLEDPKCKLEKLDLDNCSIGEEGFTALASALRSNPSHMRELFLRGSKATDSGVKHLSCLLEDPNCKLDILNLQSCSIGEEGFTALASALRSNPSHLRVLWLEGSKATDSGVKHLSCLLEDPNCKLETLEIWGWPLPRHATPLRCSGAGFPITFTLNELRRLQSLQNCSIGEEGFTALASALRSNPSHMRVLWLMGSKATDSGVKYLSSLLEDPNCKLEELDLRNCSIGEEGFTALASALRSNPSHMRVLKLLGSKATDSGVKHLSSLLEDPNCKLETLDLQNSSIGEEGFTALASALRSNPSHITRLLLMGSKATDSGVKHLSSLLEDPNCKLEELSLYNCSITDEGFRMLASALRSNPSTVRELWLGGNQPGPSAQQLLSELKKHPNCKHIQMHGV
ncbi:NACHT, LRR and PYD domains-containing protein 12-like isoform X1 [Sardina pilchardus]|uniref:NACHT, LRR and PYD domains-containing protein 12-like isoform X1 n=1 Tax=Sardina pilchardus TaxID=27697 RepID=UPI002E0E8EEA